MKNYLNIFLLLFILDFTLNLTNAYSHKAQAPQVVVSIKPMHAWVSAVMQGVGEPYLLLKNSDSVHNYALKPSDAKKLSKADIVFITDKNMETYLQKPLQNLSFKAKIVELTKAPRVKLLPVRKSGLFEGKAHGGSDYNFHFWLDPENAIAATISIAKTLITADPGNAALYQANAHNYIKKLQQLIAENKAKLQSYKNINFVVFHDAYYYYEHRFGVEALGSVTINPEHQPGAGRIEAIKNKLRSVKAACIFTEPQFSPSIVKNIIEGTSAKQGVLDPIGAELQPGPEAYFKLINNITASLVSCGQKQN